MQSAMFCFNVLSQSTKHCKAATPCNVALAQDTSQNIAKNDQELRNFLSSRRNKYTYIGLLLLFYRLGFLYGPSTPHTRTQSAKSDSKWESLFKSLPFSSHTIKSENQPAILIPQNVENQIRNEILPYHCNSKSLYKFLPLSTHTTRKIGSNVKILRAR